MAEKTLNQIPRPLREQYEKGKTAFERRNFDYAIEFLNHVLEQEPSFYEAREFLRAAQVQKASSGGTTSAKTTASPPSLR